MPAIVERFKEKLSVFLRALQEEKGISGDDIAVRSQGRITRQTVHNYVKKISVPDLEKLLIIADIANRKPGQLIDDLFEGRTKEFLDSKNFTDSDFFAMYLNYQSIDDESKKHDADVLLGILKSYVRKLSREVKEKAASDSTRRKKRMSQGDGLPRKK